MDSNQSKQAAVWQVINAIPRGRVASYGQVARLAGLGRAARFVGRTLKQLPPDTQLPWHRVIRSDGHLGLPIESEGFKRQKERLAEEGVNMIGSRVSMRHYGWDA